jgi:hypothetical protein
MLFVLCIPFSYSNWEKSKIGLEFKPPLRGCVLFNLVVAFDIQILLESQVLSPLVHFFAQCPTQTRFFDCALLAFVSIQIVNKN